MTTQSLWPVENLGSKNWPVVMQTIGDASKHNFNQFRSAHSLYVEQMESALEQEEYKPHGLRKARNYANNIADFVQFAYPLLFNSSERRNWNLQKDAPVLTTTTGFYNQIYGAYAWSQIIQEPNAFMLLAKKPWERSGWRVITTAGATSGSGQAENAALPSTIKPTLAALSTKAKTICTTFGVSALEQGHGLAGGDDMFDDPFAWMRNYSMKEHIKLINRALLTDVDTLAINDIESIDRVISSYAEVANCSITAGDSDIYSQDRDAGVGWTDSYVNHNSGTDRILSPSMVDSLFENTYPYRESVNDPYILLTGYDTWERLQQLRAPQIQYINPGQQSTLPALNGVMAPKPGVEGGFNVAYWKGVPIFVSNDVKKDTISRVYLINLNHLFIRVLMPTQYFQAGIYTNGDPFGINALRDEGLFLTMAELIATQFNNHGKLRDLK